MKRALHLLRARLAPTPLGSRGIALPVALLGLVAVSLLVTTVLLTSTTEVAVSSAQRDAARGLYQANAALEQYIATRVQSAAGTTRFTEAGGSATVSGATYAISLARLARGLTTFGTDSIVAAETWSIIAQPSTASADSGRGRAVGALFRARRTLKNVRINVNAGATSGGNIDIGGSSVVSDGSTGQVGCDSAKAGYAVEVTAGSKITAGAKNLEGKGDTLGIQKTDLMNRVLGTGVTLDDVAQSASLKFGPMFGDTFPTWSNNKRPNDSYSLTTSDSMYNWGCPSADVQTKKNTCSSATGASRFVVVAIDAKDIGSVKLNGDWGQGVLMILHGSLEIAGNFVFRGIILVDQDLKITGGNGQYDGKIEGTIVAFGENSNVTDNVNGNAMVRYNRCSINDAQNALNNRRIDDMPQVVSAPTFAWFELVR